MFWDVRKSEDEASEIENFLGKKERGQVEQWRMGRKAKQRNATNSKYVVSTTSTAFLLGMYYILKF